jgi:hypothetical protein
MATAEDGGAAPPRAGHAQLLAGQALRGPLYAQWSRQRRRRALQQRDGEEAAGLFDDDGPGFDPPPAAPD